MVKVAEHCQYLSYVVGFTSDIWHIRGTNNVVVDILYRRLPAPVAAITPAPKTLYYAALTVAQ